MKRQSILANRIREVMLMGTWIANTNYKRELECLRLETAKASLPNTNSIASLAQHVHYYIKGVKNVLLMGSLDIRDQYSFDFPELTSQDDWEAFLQLLWNDSSEFAELIESLSDEKLDAVFVQEQYGSYQRNIDAIIEHAYYHLGQIVLIKKAVSKS